MFENYAIKSPLASNLHFSYLVTFNCFSITHVLKTTSPLMSYPWAIRNLIKVYIKFPLIKYVKPRKTNKKPESSSEL